MSLCLIVFFSSILAASSEKISLGEELRGIRVGDDTGWFNLKSEWEILLNAHTSCATLPNKFWGSIGLACLGIKRARECMDIHETTPLPFVRNCNGRHCVMTLTHGRAACMLEALGYDIDPRNETRMDTCGVDPQYPDLFSLLAQPHSRNGDCIVGLPPNVHFQSLALCIDGVLHYTLLLTFPQPLEDIYDCMYNPTCVQGAYHSHIVCFTQGHKNPYNNADAESSARRARPPLALLAFQLLWIWFLT